jgi:ubiquinone/menaquinone biosynthesis C-methylase UbiE
LEQEDEKEHHDGIFPTRLSFLLNNPIRRRFDKNPERVVRMLGINNASIVLDFGCGPGFYAVPLAKVAKKVVAVDLQKKMLEKAERYAEKNGVVDKIEFVRTDGKEIPSNLQRSSCDFVFLSFVYHEIDTSSKEGVLLDLGRMLKPGGKLAIMEYTKRPLLGPHAINPDEVTKDLTRVGFPGTEVIQISKNVGLILAMKGTADHM